MKINWSHAMWQILGDIRNNKINYLIVFKWIYY